MYGYYMISEVTLLQNGDTPEWRQTYHRNSDALITKTETHDILNPHLNLRLLKFVVLQS